MVNNTVLERVEIFNSRLICTDHINTIAGKTNGILKTL